MVIEHPLDSTFDDIENGGPFRNFGKLAKNFVWEYAKKALNRVESTVNWWKEEKYEKYIKLRENVVQYILDKKIKPYCDDTTRIDILWNSIMYLQDGTSFEDIHANDSNYFEKIRERFNSQRIWRIINGFPSILADFKKIKSAPKYGRKYIDKKTGSNKKMTYCSKTAQENERFFWLNLPDWNAREWVEKLPIDNRFIKTVKAEMGQTIDLTQYYSNSWNFVDLSVKSDTRNWQKYWHRAVAFLEQNSWQWYVLDPYYSWGKWTNPQPLSEYSKKNQILQANFYAAEIQAEKNNIS